MHVLRVEGLTAGYGKAPIINGVSFHASASQVVALIGPNGAGKSTALKASLGLIPRLAGRVYLDESDSTGLSAHQAARAGMAYVPQVDNVFASMSVEENLELGGFVERGSVAARKELVFEIFRVH
jgi:branched-chain amino acid transport system ATP-binding protein